MKKVFAGIVVAAVAFTAQADLMINVDLGAGTTVGSGIAGVVASDGWQQKSSWPSFTDLSVLYADGSASGATVSGTGVGNVSAVGASTSDGDYTMYNRGLAIEGNAGYSSVSFANLDVAAFGGSYDVYVYFASVDGGSSGELTFSFSDGTTTYYTVLDDTVTTYAGSYVQATATDAGSAVLGGNYVKFSGLSSSSLTISSQNLTDVTGGMGAFTGIQIVAVPEPATVGMLGLGALVSLLVRRIRS